MCLIAGQIGEYSVEHVGQVLEFLLTQTDKTFEFHHLFLAARCCQERRNPRTLGNIFDRTHTALEILLRFDFPYFYYEHEPEAERRNRIRAKAVGALANAVQPENPFAWLQQRATQDAHWQVRRAAVQELARGWKEEAATLPWLQERATQDEHWQVRSAAVQELARGWKEEAATLPLLQERATQDDNEWVRGTAQSLANEIEAKQSER